MKDRIKWGIIGPGRIARAFAEGLTHASNGQLVAIASRSAPRAEAFAREWNVPLVYDAYEKLAKCPKVDAIYIATPHSEHHDATILCLQNKKHVLCEKPLAVNAAQLKSMALTAQKEDVLLMEGMWSRFPPLMAKVRELIQSQSLGKILFLRADFGFSPKDKDPNGRLFNPILAGGSLLDVGFYPASFASMILGTPAECVSLATLGDTKVDEQASCILKYRGGAHAILHSSIRCETGQDAYIAGTKGSLYIHKQCWKPQKMSIQWHASQEQEEIVMPFVGNGFNYEIEHFGKLIKKGEKDSDVMSLEESLSIIETMDQMRNSWGLSYPFE